MKKLLSSLVMLPLLVACQTGGGPTPVSSSPADTTVTAQGFQCPASGTRVTNSENSVTTHHGADPSDPLVCLQTVESGPRRQLLNFYTFPITDEPAVRRGFAALWPLEPGRTATFTFVGRARDGNTYQYVRRWRVERAEQLLIGGVPRNTLVLTQTEEDVSFGRLSMTSTYWFDTASRTFIKGSVLVRRGTTNAQPFEATQIMVPGP